MQKFSDTDIKKIKDYYNIQNNLNIHSKKLIEKTNKYSKLFSKIPGLLLVGVSNSTSMGVANENSDIDLFIITKKNRLWFVRISMTLLLIILRERKTKDKHKEKFCLSFFITEKNLNFKNILIENDIYFNLWLIYLKPIIDIDNSYDKLINSNKNNFDIDKHKNIIKENTKYIQINKKTSKKSCKLIGLLDSLFKKLLINRTIKKYEQLLKPYGIIIQDDILKFHPNDKRKEIRKKILG